MRKPVIQALLVGGTVIFIIQGKPTASCLADNETGHYDKKLKVIPDQ
ncbi:MAG: hypothetical protein R3275_03685 [Saprospiraceae bacterium]|nr:hypothetical protein [Saprospiraceae bacterium]